MMAVGPGQAQPGYAPEKAGWRAMLQPAGGIVLKQKASLVEAVGGDGGCCETANRYDAFHLGGPQDGQHMFSIFERSSCCMRCWCNPSHKAALTFHYPAPGGTFQDFWSYKPPAEEALMTAVKPTRCGCWACSACCMREMTLVDGNLGPNPEGGKCCCFDSTAKGKCCSWFEGNDPVSFASNSLIGFAHVPKCGGGCHPQVDLYSQRDALGPQGAAWGHVNGTGCAGGCCCFGGCLEFCCDFPFPVSSKPAPGGKGPGVVGDIATMVKKKPQGATGALKEMFTDADNYQMTFTRADLTVEQKATLLAANVFADYLYFEEGGACEICPEPNVICRFTICYMYCCGCLYPFQCEARNDNNSG